MTRAEHLAWCKSRALEYVAMGDVLNAFASMDSGLRKHSETRDHKAMEIGVMLMLGGHLNTPDEMRKFIEGIN